MLDQNADPINENQICRTVLGATSALIYRCVNDENYTMEYMSGGVRDLCGYGIDDLVQNATVSWVGLTDPRDIDDVTTQVDAAIEKNETWDIAYRVIHKDGHSVWVRERGHAVFENGELAYLQGFIVGAEAEMALRQQVENMVETTKASNQEIMELAQNIIKSIATLSILSVNARIEAARSGPAGRGFAVVAGEISKLADQNETWAKDITRKMRESAQAS